MKAYSDKYSLVATLVLPVCSSSVALILGMSVWDAAFQILYDHPPENISKFTDAVPEALWQTLASQVEMKKTTVVHRDGWVVGKNPLSSYTQFGVTAAFQNFLQTIYKEAKANQQRTPDKIYEFFQGNKEDISAAMAEMQQYFFWKKLPKSGHNVADVLRLVEAIPKADADDGTDEEADSDDDDVFSRRSLLRRNSNDLGDEEASQLFMALQQKQSDGSNRVSFTPEKQFGHNQVSAFATPSRHVPRSSSSVSTQIQAPRVPAGFQNSSSASTPRAPTVASSSSSNTSAIVKKQLGFFNQGSSQSVFSSSSSSDQTEMVDAPPADGASAISYSPSYAKQPPTLPSVSTAQGPPPAYPSRPLSTLPEEDGDDSSVGNTAYSEVAALRENLRRESAARADAEARLQNQAKEAQLEIARMNQYVLETHDAALKHVEKLTREHEAAIRALNAEAVEKTSRLMQELAHGTDVYKTLGQEHAIHVKRLAELSSELASLRNANHAIDLERQRVAALASQQTALAESKDQMIAHLHGRLQATEAEVKQNMEVRFTHLLAFEKGQQNLVFQKEVDSMHSKLRDQESRLAQMHEGQHILQGELAGLRQVHVELERERTHVKALEDEVRDWRTKLQQAESSILELEERRGQLQVELTGVRHEFHLYSEKTENGFAAGNATVASMQAGEHKVKADMNALRGQLQETVVLLDTTQRSNRLLTTERDDLMKRFQDASAELRDRLQRQVDLETQLELSSRGQVDAMNQLAVSLEEAKQEKKARTTAVKLGKKYLAELESLRDRRSLPPSSRSPSPDLSASSSGRSRTVKALYLYTGKSKPASS